MKNIKLVSAEDGDWIGLYVDGQLKIENHSLRPAEVLKALDLPFEIIDLTMDQMEEGLPGTTDELPST
jgi:hypothetical protein